MRIAIVVGVAWVVGLLSGIGYSAVSGYEYAHSEDVAVSARWTDVLAQGRWEPVAIGGDLYLRRPRVRLP